MLFIPYIQAEGAPRPLGYSVVKVADGTVWDHVAGAFVADPPAGAAVRPLAWFTAPTHASLALASADVPRPAAFGEIAVVFHADADGGAIVGEPIPVDIAPDGGFSFAVAYAR